jgi:hypothetical protein
VVLVSLDVLDEVTIADQASVWRGVDGGNGLEKDVGVGFGSVAMVAREKSTDDVSPASLALWKELWSKAVRINVDGSGCAVLGTGLALALVLCILACD